MDAGPWYYCLDHRTVEPREGCPDRVRLGPYATRVEAEHALDKVAERNEAEDAADRAWRDD